MRVSANECIICVKYCDETNSEDCQCDHRGCLHSHPSMNIVVDLKNGKDPCKVVEIGLKKLGNATAAKTSVDDAKTLFDDLCSEAQVAFKVS